MAIPVGLDDGTHVRRSDGGAYGADIRLNGIEINFNPGRTHGRKGNDYPPVKCP